MTHKRVAIVGGGPAGMAAGRALSDLRIDFKLFEAGPSLTDRRHDCSDDLGTGIGGAGLFSDGKFSFYPSGTHLYRLEGRDRLDDAYGQIEELLKRVGISVPERGYVGASDKASNAPSLGAKAYPSSYGSLEQRNELAALMIRDFRRQIRTHTRVCRIEPAGSGYRLYFDGGGAATPPEKFDAVIMATGRFGPRAIQSLLDGGAQTREQRYEFGIRIEHKNGVGFLNKVKRPDVKFILDAAGCEVRTFCTCRDGEVWMIPYGDEAALSGRSDGPPSGYSNFGLLARFTEGHTEVGREIWEHMQASLDPAAPALWQPLKDFMGEGAPVSKSRPAPEDRPWFPKTRFQYGDIVERLHPELYRILRAGVAVLIEHFPDLESNDTMCLFPAIEGVGHFPESDQSLRAGADNIWYCGDVVGRFRGLVPALVSGYYSGLAVATELGEARKSAPAREPQSVPAK